MNRIRVLLLALIALAATLVVAPSANATPVQSGGPAGNYKFIAPGQDFAAAIPQSWSPSTVRCLQNDDSTNSNVGVGFGINGGNPTNSYNTYQGILLRHWLYCWPSTGTIANLHSIVVGPGYCMRWIRYVNKLVFNGGSSHAVVYGVEVSHGYVQGSALAGNIFRPVYNGTYSIAAYLC